MTGQNRRTKIPALVKRVAIELGPRVNAYQVQARIKDTLPYTTPEVSTITYYLAHGGYARPTGRKVAIRICAPESPTSTKLLIHHRYIKEFEVLEGAGAK